MHDVARFCDAGFIVVKFRRTCTARVTVLCLCVCLFPRFLPLGAIRTPDRHPRARRGSGPVAESGGEVIAIGLILKLAIVANHAYIDSLTQPIK